MSIAAARPNSEGKFSGNNAQKDQLITNLAWHQIAWLMWPLS